jgi:hypothetical protein
MANVGLTLSFPLPTYPAPMLMKRSTEGPVALLLALGQDDGAKLARLGTAMLAAVIAAALGFRLMLALGTDFPISDGALFYDFVRAISETFPRLPEMVRYNGIDIPLAYPPLSFWAAAGLTRLGADPLQIVHYAPILMNAGYVLLFALLLLRNGHSRLFTALALLFTFTALRSFEWLVMGGGLSRSAGSLFMLLSLIAVGLPPAWTERDAVSPGRGRLSLAGLLIGLTILSHLEWGILAAACFVASRAFGTRQLSRFVHDNLIAGGIALAVVLPWAAIVVQAHGLDPFVAAGGSSDWSLSESGLKVLGALLRNCTNLFMWLGLAVMIARRDWFWPTFILLCMLLTPRQGDTPVVLAIGVMSAQGVFAFARLLARAQISPARAGGWTALLVALIVAWQIDRDREIAAISRPLSPARLDAMAWVKERHEGRHYAVVTRYFWAYDASAEWLPTLTGARSINTVQGREWLPDEAYPRWVDKSIATLKARSCRELLSAVHDFGRVEFIWAERRKGCFGLPMYRPVYRNDEVTIFEVDRESRGLIAFRVPGSSPQSRP